MYKKIKSIWFYLLLFCHSAIFYIFDITHQSEKYVKEKINEWSTKINSYAFSVKCKENYLSKIYAVSLSILKVLFWTVMFLLTTEQSCFCKPLMLLKWNSFFYETNYFIYILSINKKSSYLFHESKIKMIYFQWM